MKVIYHEGPNNLEPLKSGLPQPVRLLPDLNVITRNGQELLRSIRPVTEELRGIGDEIC